VTSAKPVKSDLEVQLSWPGAASDGRQPRPAPPRANGSRPASASSPAVDRPRTDGVELLGVLVEEVRSMRRELREMADAVRSLAVREGEGTAKPEKTASSARKAARSRQPSA